MYFKVGYFSLGQSNRFKENLKVPTFPTVTEEISRACAARNKRCGSLSAAGKPQHGTEGLTRRERDTEDTSGVNTTTRGHDGRDACVSTGTEWKWICFHAACPLKAQETSPRLGPCPLLVQGAEWMRGEKTQWRATHCINESEKHANRRKHAFSRGARGGETVRKAAASLHSLFPTKKKQIPAVRCSDAALDSRDRHGKQTRDRDMGEVPRSSVAPALKSFEHYDFSRAKICCSLTWLVAKAYGTGRVATRSPAGCMDIQFHFVLWIYESQISTVPSMSKHFAEKWVGKRGERQRERGM